MRFGNPAALRDGRGLPRLRAGPADDHCVFVLLTVMTKAASIGLGPYEILKLVPYMIPGSLPYTVPVSLLFAATVVYGRLASDNEVIAVKTAGLSAMVLIWPSILLALILSLALTHLSATDDPRRPTTRPRR